MVVNDVTENLEYIYNVILTYKNKDGWTKSYRISAKLPINQLNNGKQDKKIMKFMIAQKDKS